MDTVRVLTVMDPIPGNRSIYLWVQSPSDPVGQGIFAWSTVEFTVLPQEGDDSFADITDFRSVGGELVSRTDPGAGMFACYCILHVLVTSKLQMFLIKM